MMTIWSGPPKNPRTGNSYFDPVNNVQMIYVDGTGWIPDNSQQYYTDGIAGSPGSFTIGAPTALNIFEVNTPSGRIRANLETGEVFFPEGMHRSSALYEFWQGFSKAYMPSHTELSLAKQELALVRRQLKAAKEDTEDQTIKKIVEKVQKKYGNEKFIMTKPDDLIKLLTSE